MSPQSILSHLDLERDRTLAAYKAQPNLVTEHCRIEEDVTTGGYGHRQIHELVQNGADALTEKGMSGQIHLILTPDTLYCANEGAPITTAGVDAILGAHMSSKRGS